VTEPDDEAHGQEAERREYERQAADAARRGIFMLSWEEHRARVARAKQEELQARLLELEVREREARLSEVEADEAEERQARAGKDFPAERVEAVFWLASAEQTRGRALGRLMEKGEIADAGRGRGWLKLAGQIRATTGYINLRDLETRS
jgi:acetyl-CoA carboxylase carboxyltransferase component